MDLLMFGSFQLHGFEIPRAVYLEPNMFTPESDIVTPTLKLKRPVAQRVYQQAIDEMYASLNE
jgi:long-chain acyl-CoA synthetase